MIKVKFPSVFTQITKERKVEVENVKTVKELLDKLFERYPQLKERLIKDGEVTPFINIFVNGEDIRHLKGLDTELKDGDEVTFIPAISGG
ncbi:MoaD family protein [Ferroglobus placidus DSM 10642]|uniref:MoaD family protein n=1 Tax=Ferroglobus placidus (strain DSM 10642 / AEDII12DO) TaxID=589924 RepID=D3S0U7_FERPA|nr:ubiquitin-like small modifier protein 1 [Ferroglobus placidus]ADC66338.1 MoaD family protein [Ferroglobus placidus DSM 10642]